MTSIPNNVTFSINHALLAGGMINAWESPHTRGLGRVLKRVAMFLSLSEGLVLS
ncbi:MAG: hypothetical protein AAF732_19375 [Pseudomonadota bacterium]